MTNLQTRLDEIQGRVDAATEGPWEAREVKGNLSIALDGGEAFDFDWAGGAAVYQCDDDMDGCPQYSTQGYCDATFIANARTDVPALLAAVRAVVEVHVPVIKNGQLVCSVCYDYFHMPHIFPCPTIRALNDALGVEA